VEWSSSVKLTAPSQLRAAGRLYSLSEGGDEDVE